MHYKLQRFSSNKRTSPFSQRHNMVIIIIFIYNHLPRIFVNAVYGRCSCGADVVVDPDCVPAVVRIG